MSPDPEGVERLQAVLAGEHAAVYGYGVLGSRLDEATRRLALGAFDAHRVRRDQLVARLRERGADPAATLAAYDVQAPDRPAALALAVRLEQGLSVRWRDLVAASSDPALRALGTAGLTETAVRAVTWRRLSDATPLTEPFPGTL